MVGFCGEHKATGLDAIAQVDLGRRGHRHQDLFDLGLMSTQLLAAVARRQGHAPHDEDPDGRIDVEQFLPSDAGIERVARHVLTHERQPAREVG